LNGSLTLAERRTMKAVDSDRAEVDSLRGRQIDRENFIHLWELSTNIDKKRYSVGCNYRRLQGTRKNWCGMKQAKMRLTRESGAVIDMMEK